MEINGRQINPKGIAVASNKHSDQHQHSQDQYQHKHQHSEQHQHSQHQHQHQHLHPQQHCHEASRFDKKECFIHIQSAIYYEP